MGAMMTAEQQSEYSSKLTSHVTVTFQSICVQVEMEIAGCVHVSNVCACSWIFTVLPAHLGLIGWELLSHVQAV